MPKQKPNEQVQQIPLSEIRPFKNHPFNVTDDELMQQTIDSIMQVGVLNPAIIRPAPEGGYEMVAGHRRLHAADLAGLKTISFSCHYCAQLWQYLSTPQVYKFHYMQIYFPYKWALRMMGNVARK